MTRAQGIDIGPFSFSVIRILVLIGFVRVVIKNEISQFRFNSLDKYILVWAIWIIISSFFHKNLSDALVYRLGLVYDSCGFYFLIRIFYQSFDDLLVLCQVVSFLLIPVAVEMLHEKFTAYNLFSLLGGVPEIPYIRLDKIRAQGPFSHAILAGTVGAVFFPLMIGYIKFEKKKAIMGITACLTMIYASTSSGPYMSLIVAIGALYCWRFRRYTRYLQSAAILLYVFLDIYMKDPAYYIMARIDITGGSTGWHRARLIQSAFGHLSEWWIAGTDYTRHWMPTGVTWSPNHTDITNHYLQMGVWGGLPLMIIFIATLIKAFSLIGNTIRNMESNHSKTIKEGFIWSLGATLFVQAVTFISVCFFDQTVVFIYLTLAAIGMMADRSNFMEQNYFNQVDR
jgi:hypothetical protein